MLGCSGLLRVAGHILRGGMTVVYIAILVSALNGCIGLYGDLHDAYLYLHGDLHGDFFWYILYARRVAVV